MSHVADQYEIKDITYIINHIQLSPKIYTGFSQWQRAGDVCEGPGKAPAFSQIFSKGSEFPYHIT